MYKSKIADVCFIFIGGKRYIMYGLLITRVCINEIGSSMIFSTQLIGNEAWECGILVPKMVLIFSVLTTSFCTSLLRCVQHHLNIAKFVVTRCGASVPCVLITPCVFQSSFLFFLSFCLRVLGMLLWALYFWDLSTNCCVVSAPLLSIRSASWSTPVVICAVVTASFLR